MGWGWLSQTRPIPRSPDGDKNRTLKQLSQCQERSYQTCLSLNIPEHTPVLEPTSQFKSTPENQNTVRKFPFAL